jgi:hypothetical protein
LLIEATMHDTHPVKRALVLVMLAAGVAASVATSPADGGFVDGGLPGDGTAGDSVESDPFELGRGETQITGVAEFTLGFDGAPSLSFTLTGDNPVSSAAHFEVIHGGTPDTSETLEIDGDPLNGLALGANVSACTECVHDEPFIIRVRRTDEGADPVTARLLITATVQVDEGGAGEEAVFLTLHDIGFRHIGASEP